MYRKKREKQKKLIISGIIGLAVIIFIVINILLPNSFKVVGKFGKDGLLFMESLVVKPINSVRNKFNNMSLSNNKGEELEKKLSDYQLVKDENDQLKQEIDSLKEQLKINTILSSKKIVNATVINRNLEYWYDSLTIDKGSNDNVIQGMAVLYKGILIGKVTDVGYSNSTIRLLTSENIANKISVEIRENNKKIYGLLVGYKDGLYKVEGISDMGNISEGSTVYTTGLGNNFPEGITIGTVSNVTTDNFDLEKILEVKPDIEMDNIDFVTLVGKE